MENEPELTPEETKRLLVEALRASGTPLDRLIQRAPETSSIKFDWREIWHLHKQGKLDPIALDQLQRFNEELTAAHTLFDGEAGPMPALSPFSLDPGCEAILAGEMEQAADAFEGSHRSEDLPLESGDETMPLQSRQELKEALKDAGCVFKQFIVDFEITGNQWKDWSRREPRGKYKDGCSLDVEIRRAAEQWLADPKRVEK